MSSYTYLWIEFSNNGAWDLHIKKVLSTCTGNKKVKKLHCNRNINLSARELFLLSVIRPSLEYGSEIWESNKTNMNTFKLESIILRLRLLIKQLEWI